MTDNEIKKALEWHSNDETHCSGCPYEEHSVTHYCVDMVIQDALDLINRKDAEIERLRPYGTQVEVSKKIESEIKAEAIKEFAERVKMAFYYEFDEIIPSIMADNIDNLVKEMVGDAE